MDPSGAQNNRRKLRAISSGNDEYYGQSQSSPDPIPLFPNGSHLSKNDGRTVDQKAPLLPNSFTGRVVGALAVDESCRGRGYARALIHATCVMTWEQRDQTCREPHCYSSSAANGENGVSSSSANGNDAESSSNNSNGQGHIRSQQFSEAGSRRVAECDWLYAITSHTNTSAQKCLRALGFETFPGTYDWWQRG